MAESEQNLQVGWKEEKEDEAGTSRSSRYCPPQHHRVTESESGGSGPVWAVIQDRAFVDLSVTQEQNLLRGGAEVWSKWTSVRTL